jgi:uncharacterized membrane protein YraQ (UPF0718 family)
MESEESLVDFRKKELLLEELLFVYNLFFLRFVLRVVTAVLKSYIERTTPADTSRNVEDFLTPFLRYPSLAAQHVSIHKQSHKRCTR